MTKNIITVLVVVVLFVNEVVLVVFVAVFVEVNECLTILLSLFGGYWWVSGAQSPSCVKLQFRLCCH